MELLTLRSPIDPSIDNGLEDRYGYPSTFPTIKANGSSHLSEHSSVPIAIAQIFFTAVGLCSTLVILTTYLKSLKLRTPQNVFVINLAIADLMLLLMSFPPVIAIISGGGRHVYSGILCEIYAVLLVVNGFSSMGFMGAIGLTRFVSICHPDKKGRFITWRRCISLAIVIWIYNTGMIIPSLVGWGRITYHEKMYMCGLDFTVSKVYNFIIMLGTYCIVCCTVFICYLKIYKAFLKSKKKVSQYLFNNGGRKIKREEIRLACQLLVIFIIYNVCWGPIMMLIFIIDPLSKADTRVYEFAIFIMYINSIVNGPLYFYFNKLFRYEVLRMWCNHQESVTVPSSDNALNITMEHS